MGAPLPHFCLGVHAATCGFGRAAASVRGRVIDSRACACLYVCVRVQRAHSPCSTPRMGSRTRCGSLGDSSWASPRSTGKRSAPAFPPERTPVCDSSRLAGSLDSKLSLQAEPCTPSHLLTTHIHMYTLVHMCIHVHRDGYRHEFHCAYS